jgi:hypothetical protein
MMHDVVKWPLRQLPVDNKVTAKGLHATPIIIPVAINIMAATIGNSSTLHHSDNNIGSLLLSFISDNNSHHNNQRNSANFNWQNKTME